MRAMSTHCHSEGMEYTSRRLSRSGQRAADLTVSDIRRFVIGTLLLSLGALAPSTAAGQETLRPYIRAGSAAAPFGAATVIADFDADGAPDVAFADRLDRGGAYAIRFHLSDGGAQTVAFFSTRGALDIHAVDIDNDHDADLIVTPVLSRQVVGVWLNDGAGRFETRELAPFAPETASLLPASTVSGWPYRPIPLIASQRQRPFAATAGPLVFHHVVAPDTGSDSRPAPAAG